MRPGHTEAAVDLARLAGCHPTGVLCELVNASDGSMARTQQARAFAAAHGLKCVTIADLIRYRLRTEGVVEHVASAPLTTPHATFQAHVFQSQLDRCEHIALVLGHPQRHRGAAVRLQHQQPLRDVFGAHVQGALHAGHGNARCG